jgi:hypothetical protein
VSDASIPSIGDKDRSIGLHGQIMRPVELAIQSGPAIAGESAFARAGHDVELPVEIELEQFIALAHLDDEHRAVAIEANAERFFQLRLESGHAFRFLVATTCNQNKRVGQDSQRQKEASERESESHSPRE